MQPTLIFGLILAYPVISPIIFAITYRWLKSKQKHGWTKVLIAILFINIIVASLVFLYGYKLFAPVCLMFLPGLIGGLFLFLPFRNFQAGNSKNNLDNQYKFIDSLTAILLIGSYFLSPFVAYRMVRTCDSLHRKLSEPLIVAISSFENVKGYTPSNTEMLVPEFIKQAPTPYCLTPYALLKTNYESTQARYYIIECEDNKHYVAVVSTDLGSIQSYDFSSNVWSKVYSFDPSCDSPLVVYPDS